MTGSQTNKIETTKQYGVTCYIVSMPNFRVPVKRNTHAMPFLRIYFREIIAFPNTISFG